jgi:Cof subfamily protein (haloacid dehalogenase superfamily)
MTHAQLAPEDRWLIGIDIDGTLVHDDGFLSATVVEQVKRVRALGHEIVVATGRSAANSIPVLNDIGFEAGRAVCSNGAVTIEVAPELDRGFRQVEVVAFDPAKILNELVHRLPDAHFAVEDVDGSYRFHKPFPAYALGSHNFETPLHELMSHPVSRVVVLSPNHDTEEFLKLIEGVGLHSVSYAIGYTAWLDIAPSGVTKASALDQIRSKHKINPAKTIVIGDGRNDIPMFEWAKSGGGLAFAMGQAIDEVQSVASAITSSVEDDGVARVLSDFEGILYTRSLG